MGLDATVYRHPRHIPEHLKDKLQRDKESGCIYFKDPAADDYAVEESFEACAHHIGNVALVGFLREKIQELFGHSDSLLSKKVIYSGSHAGDSLPFSEVGELKNEVEHLARVIRDTEMPELARFVVQMRELIAAAEREENPINF